MIVIGIATNDTDYMHTDLMTITDTGNVDVLGVWGGNRLLHTS